MPWNQHGNTASCRWNGTGTYGSAGHGQGDALNGMLSRESIYLSMVVSPLLPPPPSPPPSSSFPLPPPPSLPPPSLPPLPSLPSSLQEHAAVCLTVDLLNKWLKQTKTATTLHQHPLDGTATAVPTKNEIPAATGATPGENSLETRTKGEDTPVLATGDLDTAAVPSLTTPSETTASGASDIAIPSRRCGQRASDGSGLIT